MKTRTRRPGLLTGARGLTVPQLLADSAARWGTATMTAPEGQPPAPEGTPPAPTPTVPPVPAPPPARPQTGDTPPEPGKVEDLPEWARKLVTDLRAESATRRTALTEREQQQQAERDAIAKALGLKPEDTPPDPAALQAAIAERDTRLHTQTIELAAYQAAARQGANAVALLDSRSFLTAAAKLDPAADDFAAKLDSVVAQALTDNPTLRAGQAPARGGAPFAGGPGDQRPTTLEGAVAARLAGASSP